MNYLILLKYFTIWNFENIFLYSTANDWSSLLEGTSFMVKYLVPQMLESGFTKGPPKTEKIADFIIWLLICMYFKINTSRSNFQIYWGIKILLWSVNTDWNWILITSTNLKILVTNQIRLCMNRNFPWNFQFQVIT